VCYEGALYQARKDTAQVPGGSDWICVARAGRDGCDGRTPNVCGTYDAYEKYQRLDIVTYDGASYIARRDDPGICPSGGWQLLSGKGSRGRPGEVGPRGEKGNKGARGEAAPTIISWAVDGVHYRAIPTMSNGKPGAPLDLRPLFEAYHVEAGSA